MVWIKCSKILPDDNQEVIVWDGECQYLAIFKERKDKRLKIRTGYFEIHGDDFWAQEITYWTPAPDNPKEE